MKLITWWKLRDNYPIQDTIGNMTTTSQRIVIKEMADDAHLHKDAKKYLMPVFPKTAKFYYPLSTPTSPMTKEWKRADEP